MDVPYWKIRADYEDSYNISKFPAGIMGKGRCQSTCKVEPIGEITDMAIYWTPEKEYPGKFLIFYWYFDFFFY